MSSQSSRHGELWEKAQTALDERRDPLQDAGVQAELVQHPEALRELERWIAIFENLPATPRASPRLRTAVAAMALVSVAALSLLWFRTQPRTPPTPAARAEFVHGLEWTITRMSPGSLDTLVLTERGTSSSSKSFDLPSGHAILTSEIARADQP